MARKRQRATTAWFGPYVALCRGIGEKTVAAAGQLRTKVIEKSMACHASGDAIRKRHQAMAQPWARQTIVVAVVFSCCLMHSLAVFWRQLGRKLRLPTCTEILPWREQAAMQQLFADAAAHFFGPVDPALLAEAEKMAGVLVRREAQVVQPEQHHA